MSTKQRIEAIREAFGIKSNAAMARSLGITPQNLNYWIKSDYINQERIIKAFPGINPLWFYSDDEEILISSSIIPNVIQNNEQGNNIAGQNVNISENDKLIDIIKTQSEQLSKSQEQIDRLIGIIEKMK